MKMQATSEPILKHKTAVLIVGAFGDELTQDAALVDKALNGALKDLSTSKEFSGKFKEFHIVSTHGKIAAKRVMLVGLDKKTELNNEKLRKVSGFAAKNIRNAGIKEFSTTLHNIQFSQEAVQATAEGIALGIYRFSKYKKRDENQNEIAGVFLLTDSSHINDVNRGIKTAQIISDAVNQARDISNTPANIMTPAQLADEAERVAKECKLKIKVYSKAEIEKMGMNCILAVSRGSAEEPKLIVLEHNTNAKETIAIVGKGVTFDSGGLDIKPWQYMEEMKSDKCGAAAVLGILKTAAKLNLPIHVVGVMPATENMPSGSATKPGDIVTAYNKKTVEIINTDAEGRLILADALSFTEEKFKPRAIIDLATLTGACVVALGYEAAAVLGNDEALIEKLKAAGNKSFERLWQLPVWDEYDEAIESESADVRNTNKGPSPSAGTIQGAAFLKKFINSASWAHIDIAGTSWLPAERDYQPKSATGYGVRLITQFLMDWKNGK
ncbi:MAG: leucyl aminopeptidase [Candidatus Aenigmarchaeota archaeon]|nr:leucyl aminopeptidase [Candidatus Aenigmarchaeota archaeon]